MRDQPRILVSALLLFTAVISNATALRPLQPNTWPLAAVQNTSTLPASLAHAPKSGAEPGFSSRLVQSLAITNVPHNLASAEQQLAGSLFSDGTLVTADRVGLDFPGVIHQQLFDTNGTPLGETSDFGPPRRFPGLPDGMGPNQENFTVEVVGYLKLAPGNLRLGIVGWGGCFRLTCGVTPQDTNLVLCAREAAPDEVDAQVDLLDRLRPTRGFEHGLGVDQLCF